MSVAETALWELCPRSLPLLSLPDTALFSTMYVADQRVNAEFNCILGQGTSPSVKWGHLLLLLLAPEDAFKK